jgi:predicted RNA-binding Zn ribbon-like protein
VPLFGATLQTRELLYRLFSSDPEPDAVTALARLLAATPARAEAVFDNGEHQGWRVPMHQASVAEVLAPVLWSAADLMLSQPRPRLRCCDNPQCRWLFVDDSKGGTRRWCSMSACGNRAKARRHAERQRAA